MFSPPSPCHPSGNYLSGSCMLPLLTEGMAARCCQLPLHTEGMEAMEAHLGRRRATVNAKHGLEGRGTEAALHRHIAQEITFPRAPVRLAAKWNEAKKCHVICFFGCCAHDPQPQNASVTVGQQSCTHQPIAKIPE